MTKNEANYLSHLICSRCGNSHAADKLQSICTECGSHLLAAYDLDKARQELDRDELSAQPGRQWKWAPLSPVRNKENIVHLGEGATPLLPLQNFGKLIGLSKLVAKDESINPTGTFKARGLTAAVSKAKEFELNKFIIPTAGNAGAALAAYASRAGMPAIVVMPDDTPAINIEETKAYGAEVILIEGLISDAGAKVGEMVSQGDYFNVATFKEPYRVEGKKIMGYEIAEQFNWQLPDVIIYPTGGGTGLVGMWMAFQQMLELGWLESTNMPRMVAVQADGCAPVVRAFENGDAETSNWENAQTIASGLRVPNSFAGHQILKILTESQGTAIAVSDDEISAAQSDLGQTEGIFTAPEAAATLVAAKKLSASSWIKKDESTVLFLTGAGMKYL
jgi:threonine synthase